MKITKKNYFIVFLETMYVYFSHHLLLKEITHLLNGMTVKSEHQMRQPPPEAMVTLRLWPQLRRLSGRGHEKVVWW